MKTYAEAKKPVPSSTHAAPVPDALAHQAQLRGALLRAGVSPRLEVGAFNNPLEREADAVAERVMRMPESEAKPPVGASAHVSARGNSVQAKAVAAPASPVSSQIESSLNSLNSGGTPLDGASRAFFEPRFGRDFSGVRLHTNAAAAQMTGALSARAFTLGSDIAFAPGQYSAQTPTGRSLLAHELAHVTQQQSMPNGVAQPRLIQRKDDDQKERKKLIEIIMEKLRPFSTLEEIQKQQFRNMLESLPKGKLDALVNKWNPDQLASEAMCGKSPHFASESDVPTKDDADFSTPIPETFKEVKVGDKRYFYGEIKPQEPSDIIFRAAILPDLQLGKSDNISTFKILDAFLEITDKKSDFDDYVRRKDESITLKEGGGYMAYVCMYHAQTIAIDKTTKKRKVEWTGRSESDWDSNLGIVKDFTLDNEIIVLCVMQTIYAAGVKKSCDSGYGARPTLRDHEGSHGTDFLNYMRRNTGVEFPFNGRRKTMTTVKDFKSKIEERRKAIESYIDSYVESIYDYTAEKTHGEIDKTCVVFSDPSNIIAIKNKKANNKDKKTNSRK